MKNYALYGESKCEAVAAALKDHPALAMYHIKERRKCVIQQNVP